MNEKFLKHEYKPTKAERDAERERIASLRCDYCGAHGHRASKCPVKAMDKKLHNGIFSK